MGTAHTTDAAFDEINLHDAEVFSITRVDSDIIVALSAARLTAKHPGNTLGDVAIVRPAKLTLHGVADETSRMFEDARRAYVAHPHPDQPIVDGIVENRAEPLSDGRVRFSFGAFDTRLVAWVEWTVVADGFNLGWEGEVGRWRGR